MAADDAGIWFGERLVGLLDGGRFTATYKYAVLLALIDLCGEHVDAHGRPPASLSGKAVGRRVFALYWPQARPLGGVRLRQSTQPGDIVSKIEDFKRGHGVDPGTPLRAARRAHPDAVAGLEEDVAVTIVQMPLPRLQRFGAGSTTTEVRFLYEFGWTDAVSRSAIRRADFDDELRFVDDAALWLVRMAGLLRPLIQQQWAGFAAERNRDHLDEAQLDAFLFGEERSALTPVRSPLVDAQEGACFYCRGPLARTVDVDHFLPWARHPDDGLFNLVAAHPVCNNAKRAALAAVEPHLQRWTRRFDPGTDEGRRLLASTSDLVWPRHPGRTAGTARSLYLWLPPGTPLWQARGRFAPSSPRRAREILTAVTPARLAAEESTGYGD